MTLKEYKKDNQILRIIVDEDSESPREWDNIGTVVSWHSRYNLGDGKQWNLNMRNYNSAHEVLVKEILTESVNPPEYDDDTDYAEVPVPDDIYVLPLYMYDHSGITISTGDFSCPWDSGQFGFIFTTKAKMDKEGLTEEYCQKTFGKSQREKAIDYLEGEVETYDQYLCGDVFGFTITETKGCDCCGHSEEEFIDSCWGYYPDKEGDYLDVIDINKEGWVAV